LAQKIVWKTKVATLYFDVIIDTDAGWEVKNQLFYESYENVNENAYGFSQFHETYVIEEKLVLSKTYTFDSLVASVQLSPSIRFTDFEHGDDYTNEYFGRRDLTGPSTALDARLLATSIDDDYTEYYIGEYTDIGLAFLTDLSWENGLSLLIGARHDRFGHGKPTACGQTVACQLKQLLHRRQLHRPSGRRRRVRQLLDGKLVLRNRQYRHHSLRHSIGAGYRHSGPRR
jgi:hypothetical protein